MKRFYAAVDTAPEAVGHVVRLDARPVRTPARNALAIPSLALAEAVAEEWRRQGEEIAPDTMPLTRLATTVLDLMPARREDAVEEAAGFAGTDLLCYRAAAPQVLSARQRAAWQPWLDWAERQYDARLIVTDTVDPLPQPEAALQALRRAVERLDDWRLVGLHAATTLTGSLVLALALERQALDTARAFETALLDELFEIERWGEETMQQRRHARLRTDLEAAATYLRLLVA
jgi:chaperone required for assembly of F1-ATPase